jgi:sodium/proline symporter
VWWKKANTVGAIASMLAGTTSSVLWELLGMSDKTGLDPMVIGIVSSTAAMIIGSLLTQESHAVPQSIQRALDETAKIGPIPASLMLGQDQHLAAQAEMAGREK